MAIESTQSQLVHGRFIGRDAQIRRLREHLAAGDSRIVTLVGMGGSGKTTIARYFSEFYAEADAGRFVDLSDARTAEDVLRAVASALDLTLNNYALERQIGWALASRGPTFLVLDGFENVVHEAEATLGTWAPRAPEVHFLVTSRVRLGVEGERVIEVGPLDPEDAVMMFLGRAGLTTQDGDLLRGAQQFVKQLDHLPLAIELAAAWLRARPPEARWSAICAPQSDEVGLPFPPRHHPALTRALETSWAMLPPWGRLALTQVSVFQGGFTLDLAERVLDLSGLDEAPWPVDAVQTLVDHSLVQAHAGPQGAIRFGLLDTVSDWATGRLHDPAAVLGADGRGLTGPAAHAALRSRHAVVMATHGTPEALRALETHGGSARRAELLAETENLRAALDTAIDEGDQDTAANAAMALGEIAFLRGPFLPGLGALDRAMAMPGQTPRQLGRLGVSRARLLVVMGRPEEVDGTLERAIRHARSVEDRSVEASALVMQGVTLRNRGQTQAALRLLEAATALAREQDDRVLQGYASGNLGVACKRAGDVAGAERWIGAAIALARDAGDRRREGLWAGFLAGMLAFHRSFDQALPMFYDAIGILREVGDRHHEGLYLGNLGIELRVEGRLEEARAVSEQGLQVARQMGSPGAEAACLINLGLIAMRLGDLPAARITIERSISLYRESGERRVLDIARGYLGELLLAMGEQAEAEVNLRACVEACDALGHAAAGAFRGPLALLCALQGRLPEAFALLDEGAPKVEGVVERAVFQCKRASVLRLAGDRDLAETILAEIRAIAGTMGAMPSSDLGVALAAAEAATDGARTG